MLHEDVDPTAADVTRRLAGAARQDAEGLQTGRRKVRVTIQEDTLADLAALDEVHHIVRCPVGR